MARRRRSRRNRSGFGRFLEGMAVLVLVLIVLTFGISIASRYSGPNPVNGTDSDPGGARDLPGIELRTSGPPVEPLPPPEDRPEIEISNGCGRSGLAQELRFELQGPWFDVVDTGNADHYDYVKTEVVAAEADSSAAQSVASFLQERFGVGIVRLTEKRPGGLADVRVVIGADLADAMERGSDPSGRRDHRDR
jgi:hypothetical protein